MSARKGDHLGAVHDIESLRLRCYCPAHDECWHLRSARGKAMPLDRVHAINVFGRGKVTIGRAIWHLLGRVIPGKMTVYRTCDSYDCANPAHFRCGSRRSYIRLFATRGQPYTQLEALRVSRERHTKVTAELRRWVNESEQGAADVAHAMNCSSGRVSAIRREMRVGPMAAASVFQLGAIVAADQMRRAA